ncbi:MAG TPA: O-antigen ligase family protein [Anaerolineales bacterium]|nr:O-antigen ligase family protein [Anaerolineales bacterium]
MVSTSPITRLRHILPLVCLLFCLSASALSISNWQSFRQAVHGQQKLSAKSPVRPSSVFGINIDLVHASPAERETTLQAIQQAGFGWVRQEFSWAEFQPTAEDYRWHLADELITQITRTHQLNLLAVITDSPAWASSDPNQRTAPPRNSDDFAHFVYHFANRYGPNIRAYQIWDEPNLQSGWGNQYPDPIAYAQLLASASAAIRKGASGHYFDNPVILVGGLAPTVEQGPNNISDITYLQRLYTAGAAPYFDGVAAKPYGFDFPPNAPADPATLNFARSILLHDVMVQNGDNDKLLWGSQFGWNALPADWQGEPSLWGETTLAQQSDYTMQAYQRVHQEWSWAGVFFLEEYQTHSTPQDAWQGFSLIAADGSPRPAWLALQAQLPNWNQVALPGLLPPETPAAQYTGKWKLSVLGADLPADGGVAVLRFYGTDIGLLVRRGNFRAHFTVRVDGQPANLLPQTAGQSFLTLTSPNHQPSQELLWLAKDLPLGTHTLELAPFRGWDQWVLVGYAIADNSQQPTATRNWAILSTLLALLFAVASVWAIRQAGWAETFLAWSAPMQWLFTAANTLLLWLTGWLAFSDYADTFLRRHADWLPLVLTATSTALFFFSPWTLGVVLAVAMLAFVFILRPTLALPVIACSIPLYLLPRPLWERAITLLEVASLLTLPALAVLWLKRWRAHQCKSTPCPRQWNWLDSWVLAFVLWGVLATVQAQYRNVAVTEFRIMILEPALLYLLIRSVKLTRQDLLFTLDGLLAGGIVVAVVGLWQYVSGNDLIVTLEGAVRIRSVYGSPNNVGLYLGRLLPIALALSLLGKDLPSWRRWGYALLAGLFLLTIGLSLSRGAILLGVPAALLVVLGYWQAKRLRRWGGWLLGGGAFLTGVAIWLAMQLPRFAGLFNRATGPTFFRLNLWQSALQMFSDHWLVGVGPDNFLYYYRGWYIQPAAWQDPNLSHAHNWLLDFATRLGLPGLLLFIAIVVWMLMRLLPIAHKPQAWQAALAVGLLGALANMLTHGLVDASFWFVDLAFVFFLLVGLASSLSPTQPNDPALTENP